MTATVTDTYLLLRAFCDELARCGVTDACTSPGSRSTPIVLSLARERRLRSWSHVDERVSGFFALGLAKQTGRPVAITVTSGTAAAELAPAVIEAAEARVPLIVLTSDRPPELRDVGAGQTIDQLKLYGGAAKWFTEVGVVGEATPAALRWMRTLACRAVWTAQDGRPGVVHLNMPLREPLVLSEPLPQEDPLPGRPDGRPWVARGRRIADASLDGIEPLPHGRGVIVAGQTGGGRAIGLAIASAAEAIGYVLLADPLSQARRGPNAVAHYDALLRDAGFLSGLDAPQAVLRIGDLPTSKPLRGWLAGLDPKIPQIALDPHHAWHDPDAVVSTRLERDLDEALPAFARDHSGIGDATWVERWRVADGVAGRAIAATIGSGAKRLVRAEAVADGDATLSEPLVAIEAAAALDAGATLVVAASMPIRDVETFLPARDDGPRVLSNRGANGIDGTVATALGAAAAGDGPVVLLIGDVTLAYDLGALLSARRLQLDLTIVLIDNDGGGIFHFLPVATQSDHFEHHIATPHGLDFAVAAQLYGARHVPVATAAELRAELARATRPGAGVTIVQATTDRDENVLLHRHVWAAVAEALAAK
ncbi:2-succinyl-5-enolpyruvyl-6-hydroxy-3-cyclohexene-1-carboxylic-acid synthase [Conexibacter sp. CPCC 206217]|uniref:2-succinyl-5-enolpyruvyl-6-hydroxy-3- cyclohexene-1-carboxylic-acid synthase n=1 Tax=Conexibacter sp. CPCC 206217 TaxID=3064574 RepID=UPI002724489F|nr:2-succinyl-5-enolpyruvyl-6-hydroxy-3-cyclohexene-1-carboxylic-acid synthase [Conexibacter sp. CPCC 206217]MDO8212894.1 2-succinyl-5-enolpyruvyl-6-hydroxy-3-cyclohexene-1-carboxylic-acid synthase [Conexibacter sp. CPCC 206217]